MDDVPPYEDALEEKLGDPTFTKEVNQGAHRVLANPWDEEDVKKIALQSYQETSRQSCAEHVNLLCRPYFLVKPYP